MKSCRWGVLEIQKEVVNLTLQWHEMWEVNLLVEIQEWDRYVVKTTTQLRTL